MKKSILSAALCALFGVLIVSCLPAQAQVQGRSVVLDDSYVVSGGGGYSKSQVAIGHEVYDGYIWFDTNEGKAVRVYSIKGWDHFIAYVGGARRDDVEGNVTIEIDRQQVWTHNFRMGDAAVAIDIPITGARSMAITVTYPPRKWYSPGIVFGEPTLTLGKPVPSTLIGQLVQLLLDLRSSAQQGNQKQIVDYIDQRLDKMGVIVNITPRYTEWHLR
ncbi:MAG: NPCBM/NEW2 domain-containing protein [Armatimonadota bacterium]